jgi:hypothetical protein
MGGEWEVVGVCGRDVRMRAGVVWQLGVTWRDCGVLVGEVVRVGCGVVRMCEVMVVVCVSGLVS